MPGDRRGGLRDCRRGRDSVDPAARRAARRKRASEGLDALEQLFPIVHNERLPLATLQRLQKQAYWRFYTRPGSILNLGRKLTNGRNVHKVVRAVTRRIFERDMVSVN